MSGPTEAKLVIVTLQKWVNLYDIMIDNFKGKGHCVTMDSAYMGDIMALSGRHEWKINMLGTAQENRTDAATAAGKKAVKKNTYETLMWQHDTESLCYVIWSDNNFLRTLSNFQTPNVVDAGIKRRRVNDVRERELAVVPCHSRTSIILRPSIKLTRGMAQRPSMSWEDKVGHMDGPQSCPVDYST